MDPLHFVIEAVEISQPFGLGCEKTDRGGAERHGSPFTGSIQELRIRRFIVARIHTSR